MNEQTTPQGKENVLEMIINDFDVSPIVHEGYYPISLKTSRGNLECRYYASAERRRAVVFAGDMIGGWDSPVRNLLYPSLCKQLSRKNLNCLRVKYRHPENLAESILDVMAGITFLMQDGVETIGLVGHSFGGAAVIQAAAASPIVSTVISIAPQTFGTDAVHEFRETQSLLLIHGTHDVKNDPSTSVAVYEYAHNPKKIMVFKNASHNLDEVAPEMYHTVKDWLYKKV